MKGLTTGLVFFSCSAILSRELWSSPQNKGAHVSISASSFLQYVLLVLLLCSVGIAAGYMQRAYRTLLGNYLPVWVPALSRLLLFFYAIGMICYGVWVLAGIYERVELPLFLVLALSQCLYLFILPCAACSVIERRLIFPWTFLSPSFYRHNPHKGEGA